MKITLSKNLFFFILLVLIFRISLELSYVNVISVIFSYSGYDIDFNFQHYIFSWIIFLTGFFVMKDRVTRISDCFFVIAFLAVITPLTVIYGYDFERTLFPSITSLLAIFFINLIVQTRIVLFKNFPVFKNGIHLIILVSLIFVVFLIIWYLISGVKFNLDFSKVYEFREQNTDLVAKGFLGYTNNWTYKVFNITLFTLALLYKRYFLVLIIFLIQVFFYATSAYKEVLFLPFLILGVWFYLRKTNSLIVIPLSFSLVIFLTLFTYYLMDDIWMTSLFSRRIFFVPALITYSYFDFFSDNPYLYWSNSILSSFLNYTYEVELGRLIGNYLKTGGSANNGFISSGFAHAGLLGVAFYSLIIGLILRFLNDITHNLLPIWFAVSLTIVPIQTLLISSDLFTTMLTHGFIIVLIIIFFIRSKKHVWN